MLSITDTSNRQTKYTRSENTSLSRLEAIVALPTLLEVAPQHVANASPDCGRPTLRLVAAGLALSPLALVTFVAARRVGRLVVSAAAPRMARPAVVAPPHPHPVGHLGWRTRGLLAHGGRAAERRRARRRVRRGAPRHALVPVPALFFGELGHAALVQPVAVINLRDWGGVVNVGAGGEAYLGFREVQLPVTT